MGQVEAAVDDEEEMPEGTGNCWTAQLIDLLCSLHIPILKNYNKYGKFEKEKVSLVISYSDSVLNTNCTPYIWRQTFRRAVNQY